MNIEEVLKEHARKIGVIKPKYELYEFEAPKVREVVSKLLEALGRERVFVTTIVGTDRPDEGVIELTYFVYIVGEQNQVIALRTRVPRDNARIPSIVDIVPSALYAELEIYDLLGVVFEGNDRLRRGFLVPPEIVQQGIYPLRKDARV